MAEKLRTAVAVGIAFPPYPAATKAAASHPLARTEGRLRRGSDDRDQIFSFCPGRLWQALGTGLAPAACGSEALPGLLQEMLTWARDLEAGEVVSWHLLGETGPGSRSAF